MRPVDLPCPPAGTGAAGAVADRAARALAAAATRVSFLCEPDGTVAWISPSCRALLGLDPATLLGTRIDHRLGTRQTRLVLGGDGRPRRVDVHTTDLDDDPDVRGVLVEWVVHPDPGDAGRDPVTGLLTLASVAERVARVCAQGDPSVAVIRLRADRPLPDAVLHQVGQRLANALRADDIGGRLPDGDVVVVCPGAWTVAAAGHVAQRLRSHVNGPVRGTDGMVSVRLWAGAATGPASTFETLLQRSYHELVRSGWRMLPEPGASDGVDPAADGAPVPTGT